MAESQSIYALMSQAIAAVPSVGKNSQAPASMGGYMFRGIEDVLAALKPIIARLGLFPVPVTLERIESERKVTGGKAQYVVDLHIQWTWYGPLGDSIVATTWGEGSDMGDKATQKAHTAAYKTMMVEVFMLADVESDSERHIVPDTEGTTRSSRPQSPPDPPPFVPDPMMIYGPDGISPIMPVPAGWADAVSCNSAHDGVKVMIRTALASLPEADRAEARKPWDEHKDAYGWPMIKDALIELSLMVAKVTQIQEARNDQPAPGTPSNSSTPQDGPSGALSGEPGPECPWCGKAIELGEDHRETPDGPMHVACFHQSGVEDSGRAFDASDTAATQPILSR